MVALVSSTLPVRESWWETGVGNFPALFRPGPRSLGICLINESEAKKAEYFLAVNNEKIYLELQNLKTYTWGKCEQLFTDYLLILSYLALYLHLDNTFNIHFQNTSLISSWRMKSELQQ